MFCKLKAALLCAAMAALAGPASAQVSSLSLGDVDPFGRGYLEEGETAMPTNMWKASRTEDLLPLMRQVRTRQLTPSERMLLRRVVLSPAARPEGERAKDVLAERARILYELGEADAASDLLGRLEDNPRGLNAAELSVDLQLALGNEASACASLSSETREGAFWAKLRAVCAVLQNNAPAAELALELAQAQGVNDTWFGRAIFAASLDDPTAVPARFDSGLNLALSTHIGLEPPVNAITASRPDLAAAMARREAIPLGVRVQAAGVAAEAGLLDGAAHRQLYARLVGQEGYQPARPIEIAVSAFNTVGGQPNDRARKLSMALRSSTSNPARFAAAARLFADDLRRVARNPETARHALVFARAAIANGDFEAAENWVRATRFRDAPTPDAFDLAFVKSVLVLAGHYADDETRQQIADELVEAATDSAKTAQAARIFALWTARYVAPPPAARALMAGARQETGSRQADWRNLAIRAAAEADAAGEVVIATLGLTRGDPTGVATADLLTLLDALAQIGTSDAAEQLALEASGYWKSPRR